MITLGLYRDGDSVFHRGPAWLKLAALVVLGAASVFIGQSWWVVLVAAGVVGCCYLIAGFSPLLAWRQLRPMVWILLFTAAMNWWNSGWRQAIAVPGIIAVLVLAAALVTLTTRTTALVDVIVRLLGPLARFGVNPHRVGLIILIGIRCVPVVAGIAKEVREAQIARRATSSLRAFAVPLLVRALRDADALGEALVARGFDD